MTNFLCRQGGCEEIQNDTKDEAKHLKKDLFLLSFVDGAKTENGTISSDSRNLLHNITFRTTSASNWFFCFSLVDDNLLSLAIFFGVVMTFFNALYFVTFFCLLFLF